MLAEAQGLTFSTADPTFFIWFDLAAGNPIKFSEGAPAGCKATIADPQQGGGDLQKLAEQVTAPAGGQTGGQGFAVSTGKVVSVSCGKS